MKHSFDQLKVIMPGDWIVHSYKLNPSFELINDPSVIIHYPNGYAGFISNGVGFNWWVREKEGIGGSFLTEQQVLKFYKRHFVLSNFK